MPAIDSIEPTPKQILMESALQALSAMNREDRVSFIERKHPLYEEKIEHWNFCEDTYSGGREWFEKNIFKYHKEGETQYANRLERAYRPNHTKEVVDLVNKYIFKSSISRKEDAPDYVKKFWKNSTTNGRNITDFVRLVSQKASVYGKVWAVVDSTYPSTEMPKTLAEKDSSLKIYAYILEPRDVLDMAFDELGELNWIKVKERVRDDSFISGNGKIVEQIRFWTKDFWIVVRSNKDKDYTVVEASTHDLGVVPIIDCTQVMSEDNYCAPSLIDDVAYLDRAVANYLSNLDAIIQDQTYSQLVIPAQSIRPDDDGYDKMIEMGTKSIFTYDNSSSDSAPHYISPDHKQAGVIIDTITHLVTQIYSTVGMAGERTKQDNAAGIDNSSGVAKAYDFERMNAMLASKASSLELFENRLLKLVAIYNNQSVSKEDLVKYPSNFDVRSLYDEFEIAKQLKEIEAPDELRKVQMKSLSDKLFTGYPDAITKKIESEIESDWPKDPIIADPNTTAPKSAVKTTKENKQGQNNKPAAKTNNL